ncbi:unnamed protein product [Prunus armeniaca]
MESLQHVFIRCPRTQAIWNSFSLLDSVKVSLSTDFNCWLRLNLKTIVVNAFNLRWCNIFATGCWFIWKWRCCSLFDSSFHYPDLPNEWILRFLVEWDIANKKGGVHRLRMQTLLAWKPPPVSIMKLNIDGSIIVSSGAIAARGLILNSTGEWVAGFSTNLGHGEILVAELWALVCWKSSWDCRIFHVFREVNFVADSLAKMGHEMEMGIHCFVLLPGGITSVLQEDRDGLLRLWVHENEIVLSTSHQCFKFYKGGVEKILDNVKLFTKAESYFADAKFYINEDMVSKVIPVEEGQFPFTKEVKPRKLGESDMNFLKELTTMHFPKLSNLDISKSSVPRFIKPSQDATRHESLPVKRTKEGFDPNTYKLMSKAGYNFGLSPLLGELNPYITRERTHDLNETQKKLKDKGYTIDSARASLGFTPITPINISTMRKEKKVDVQHISVKVVEEEGG